MTEFKSNFRQRYQDQKCSLGCEEKEAVEYIIVCKEVTNEAKIDLNKVKDGNLKTKNDNATKLTTVIKKFEAKKRNTEE